MEIYVGNLPYSATREDVAALFRPYGDVRDVRVVTDRETRRSKGFAFVTMPDTEARRAIEALNGSLLDGRRLRINAADRGGRRNRDRPR